MKRIEELLTSNAEKDKVIEDLRGFRSEAARIGGGGMSMGGGAPGNKRQRVDAEAAGPGGPPPAPGDWAGPTDTWDLFGTLIRDSTRAQYY